MYQHILVAVDGSDTADHALAHAIALAKFESARLLAVYVVEYPSTLYTSAFFDVEPFHSAMVKEAESVLRKTRSRMHAAGLKGETRVVDAGPLGGNIAEELQRTAKDAGADLVVMGTHGRRGFRRLMLGSVAESYVRLSDCPVILVPYRKESERASNR